MRKVRSTVATSVDSLESKLVVLMAAQLGTQQVALRESS